MRWLRVWLQTVSVEIAQRRHQAFWRGLALVEPLLPDIDMVMQLHYFNCITFALPQSGD